MTFKKIMLFFLIGLPVCVIARIIQVAKTIEYSNGFYFNDQKVLGNIILVIILAVCIGLGLAAFKAYKTPENPPKANVVLSGSAVFAMTALVIELFLEQIPVTVSNWHVALMKIVTLVCILYFAALALQSVIDIKIPKLCHIIPYVYAVGRTIFTFIGVSSLALISDNILLVAAYCLLMMFFINYGKLYNGLDTDLNFRKILATGLTVSIICISQSLAYFLVNIFSAEKYVHADLSSMFALLALGVFAIVFTVSHFKETV